MRTRAGLHVWRRALLAIFYFAILGAVGCAAGEPQASNDAEPLAAGASESTSSTDASGTGTPGRLEDSWGPGDVVALATGTVASKNRNLAFNVPLISWYIRNENYKGFALVGGLLAFDMVTNERSEGQVVAKEHKSAGPLWLFGKWEKRYQDGSGSFCKHHWFFPFYRYQNVNGERTLYPLFVFPMSLTPEKPPLVENAGWSPDDGDPIDPIEDPVALSGNAAAPPTLTTRSAPFRGESTPKSSMDNMSEWLDAQRADAPVAESEPGATITRGGEPALRSIPARGGKGRGTDASRASPTPAAPASPAVAESTHTVRKGDTLFGIAKKSYGSGSGWKRILEANKDTIASPDRLREGMVLRIPPR